MKLPFSLHRVALAALALSIAFAPATFANANTKTGSPNQQNHQSILTDAERAQLKSAKQQVFAANPSLKTQKHDLKKQLKALVANKATPDQFKALHQQRTALPQQLRAAELKVDPKLAPIFAKLDAAKHGHHHHHST